MLFTEASIEQATVIRNCLERFCKASGHKVSFSKSRLYFSNNVPFNAREAIGLNMKIELTEDLVLYLGMSTLTSRLTRETLWASLRQD